ncbi:MAG: GntR family transcriptional regulator [Pseudonocardia sp.]
MQVVAHIRGQIRSGQLREGDHVPSAREITRDWGVSLATATKVLAALQSEGLARGVPGVGTVVVGTAETAKDRLTSIRQTGRIYPADEHARITSAELVAAPDDVANALGIPLGAPAIRRQRVTYRGEQPVSASTSWYDGALAKTAPLLLVAERIRQGTPRYVEEQTGRTVVTGRDHVGARLATGDDATALHIEVGAAVLHGQNWFYDAAGDVIEYGQYRSAGERLRSYEYRVED